MKRLAAIVLALALGLMGCSGNESTWGNGPDAKTPAIVEGHRPVELRVPPRERDRVGIEVVEVGAADHPYTQVIFMPCENKRRTIWPAGFALRDRSPVTLRVPTISTFYGIVVRMFYSDHVPPHFHVSYGGQEAQIAIATGEPMGGRLSSRASRLVREWTKLHRAELDENWRRARKSLPLERVEPLP